MTATKGAWQDKYEDEQRRRARLAWDVGWSLEQGVDELRLAYARLALNLSRVRALVAGSQHPLPARALRRWNSALTLANHAERSLIAGVDVLRQLPGIETTTSITDMTTALGEAIDGVRASVTGLIELRDRIDTATTGESGEVLPAAALSRFREGAGVIDELTARIQQGCAALAAYTDGVAGMDPMPGRTTRAKALAQATWYRPDGVAIGAKLAARFVAEAARRPQQQPVPAHLRRPAWYRRAAWRSWRGLRAFDGSWLFGTRTDTAFLDNCLRALLLLACGNATWYAHRLDRFHRAGRLSGYAEALAAAVVVAVDRRLTWGRDSETVRRLATRIYDRYDGGTREVSPDDAEALIRAALGAARVPEVDPVRLTLLQTLLLLELLADEQLTRADRAAFRAEAVEVALALAPALQTATPPSRERSCDG